MRGCFLSFSLYTNKSEFIFFHFHNFILLFLTQHLSNLFVEIRIYLLSFIKNIVFTFSLSFCL